MVPLGKASCLRLAKVCEERGQAFPPLLWRVIGAFAALWSERLVLVGVLL